MHALPPRLLLLDFDGLLAGYSHPVRIAHLARSCDADPQQVAQAVFASGLETAYDSGLIDTGDYLDRIGQALHCRLDAETWIAARVASCRAQPPVVELVRRMAQRMPVGILSNNGALMAEAMPRIVPELFPLLHGRVLCSGMLGARKPTAEAFARALAHFDTAPGRTLFVDDLFANVRGARAAGLQAETAKDARSLRKVLKRYRLA